MKKAELIAALEGATGQTKAAVTAVVDALPGVVVTALKEHGALTLPGLAKIEAKSRAARMMRNPATGAAVEKPATVVAQFKPLKGFKDTVAAFPAKA
jgi:DNA-binding protein HU-beta